MKVTFKFHDGEKLTVEGDSIEFDTGSNGGYVQVNDSDGDQIFQSLVHHIKYIEYDYE